MANDSTVTVAFEADTSGLEAGIDDINASFAEMGSSGDGAAQDISSAFSTMENMSQQVLKGILQGTQTWEQAIARSLSNIVATYANTILWIVPNWLASELEMTLATQSGTEEREGLNAAAGAADIATQNQDTVATLGSDAALAYGGVFAFLAPEMGPAAAGPAAAAEAQVMSMASLDVGAWNVPQNMAAYLHAGEMVVPADFASGLRGGGIGGGGDNYTINISAIDTQTGAQFLKNNASVIANTLSSQVRSFNKSVPAWKG